MIGVGLKTRAGVALTVLMALGSGAALPRESGTGGGSGAHPAFGPGDTVQVVAHDGEGGVRGLLAQPPVERTGRLPADDGMHYAAADLDYFTEVALGAEYGTSAKVVRKWAGDVLVQVFGTPSETDLAALDGVLGDLRGVMSDRRIERVDEGGNLEVHFAPEDHFSAIDPNYKSTNYGFFWVWWGGDNLLVRSRVLISTSDISQEARSHLIREEVTQSLGMMNDSWRYPESIYYQGWTRTGEYAAIDRVVIEMLYRDEIRAGMTGEEALAVLRDLPRRGVAPTVVAAN